MSVIAIFRQFRDGCCRLCLHFREASMARAASLLLSIAVISAVSLAGFGQSAPNLNERDLPTGWAEAPSSKANPGLWECASYGGSVIVSLEGGSVRIGKPPDE